MCSLGFRQKHLIDRAIGVRFALQFAQRHDDLVVRLRQRLQRIETRLEFLDIRPLARRDVTDRLGDPLDLVLDRGLDVTKLRPDRLQRGVIGTVDLRQLRFVADDVRRSRAQLCDRTGLHDLGQSLQACAAGDDGIDQFDARLRFAQLGLGIGQLGIGFVELLIRHQPVAGADQIVGGLVSGDSSLRLAHCIAHPRQL